MTEWRDDTYREAFEGICRYVEDGLKDNTFTREEIERMLEAAYVDQGNDWLGRGALQDITQAATIAAYEHVLAELAAKDESPDAPEGTDGA